MVKNILSGIHEYSGTLNLISKLKLWKYFAVPIFISILFILIIGIEVYVLSDNIGAFISKIWFWEWGKETFTIISNFIGGLIVFILGLILYKHIIMALSAPFMTPVSEKIEKHFYGDLKHLHRNTSNFDQLLRGIKVNFRNLIRELIITIPFLLLKFIPIVNIFSTVGVFLVQAYYAGFGNIDYTLERHLDYKQSIDFVKKNKGFAIGNGIIFTLLLFIPFIGVILVLPLSVTAASTKTLKILHGNPEIIYER